MNPDLIKDQVFTMLEGVLGSDAVVCEEYTDRKASGICRQSLVTLGMEEGNEKKVKLSITVYVPFSQHSSGCQAIQQKIRQGFAVEDWAEFQTLTEMGVGYRESMRAYSLRSVALFEVNEAQRKKTTSVVFGSTTILAEADSLKLCCQRQITRAFSPYIGDIVQDLGMCRRTLAGKMSGDEAEYQRLYLLYQQGTRQTVQVGSISFAGILSELSTDEIYNDQLVCSFVFTEVPA